MNPRRRPRYPLSLRRRPVRWEKQQPTWRQARPSLIAEALKRAQAQPSGNWYVVGATRDVRRDRPLSATVAGQEVVVWRTADGRLAAGPGICPHLGAPLADSPVRCGTLVCHWHGLALDGGPFAGWEPLPVHDDGVLVWVRLDAVGGEPPTPEPAVPERPEVSRAVAADGLARVTAARLQARATGSPAVPAPTSSPEPHSEPPSRAAERIT